MTTSKDAIQLSLAIRKRLLHEIKEGAYAGLDRLPPEVVLAEQLGVSRTLLRDCLVSLEREGFINRKHGVGTVINKHVLKVTTRMDLEEEFLEMINKVGYEAKIDFVEIERKVCNEEIATRLNIRMGEEVYIISRLITADGKPAIYCKDYLALSNIKTQDYNVEDLKKPIFYFLETYCKSMIDMDITNVNAILADEKLSQIFKIEQGSPILHMDEIGYDFNGNPVLWSDEFYVDGIIQHTVLRKKI